MFRFFEISVLLYKKDSPGLQDWATSRFQICMQDAVVRCVPYPLN
jgi:hypothetical protein